MQSIEEPTIKLKPWGEGRKDGEGVWTGTGMQSEGMILGLGVGGVSQLLLHALEHQDALLLRRGLLDISVSSLPSSVPSLCYLGCSLFTFSASQAWGFCLTLLLAGVRWAKSRGSFFWGLGSTLASNTLATTCLKSWALVLQSKSSAVLWGKWVLQHYCPTDLWWMCKGVNATLKKDISPLW